MSQNYFVVIIKPKTIHLTVEIKKKQWLFPTPYFFHQRDTLLPTSKCLHMCPRTPPTPSGGFTWYFCKIWSFYPVWTLSVFMTLSQSQGHDRSIKSLKHVTSGKLDLQWEAIHIKVFLHCQRGHYRPRVFNWLL